MSNFILPARSRLVDRESRNHKTPPEQMCGLRAILMHWFPERAFIFAGDNAYGSHAVARFAFRYRKQVALVSKFVPDANLFEPPPKRKGKVNGRPRVKGASPPSPQEVVAKKK